MIAIGMPCGVRVLLFVLGFDCFHVMGHVLKLRNGIWGKRIRLTSRIQRVKHDENPIVPFGKSESQLPFFNKRRAPTHAHSRTHPLPSPNTDTHRIVHQVSIVPDCDRYTINKQDDKDNSHLQKIK